MPREHFAAFAEAAARSHAEDGVESGRWAAHESERLARSEFDRLLPQGPATPEHDFYEILAEPNATVIGFVWFGRVPRRGHDIAFVFQIFIYPAYRRQGYGRAALLQVEALASGRGLPAIALHVFGSNAGAQALYRSLGYTVTSLTMQKALAPAG